MSKMHEIANDIANAHIVTRDAKFELVSLNDTENNFLAVVTHPKLSYKLEEAINVNGLLSEVAEEYMHCRIHGIAAKLISKLNPQRY